MKATGYGKLYNLEAPWCIFLVKLGLSCVCRRGCDVRSKTKTNEKKWRDDELYRLFPWGLKFTLGMFIVVCCFVSDENRRTC